MQEEPKTTATTLQQDDKPGHFSSVRSIATGGAIKASYHGCKQQRSKQTKDKTCDKTPLQLVVNYQWKPAGQ